MLVYLKSRFDLEPTDPAEIFPGYIERLISNLYYSIINPGRKVAREEMALSFHALARNEKSALYYQCRYLPISLDERIFVIFETKTGAISSNSDKLKSELYVEHGIDKLDYDNETPMLLHYLSSIEFNRQKVYDN